MSTTTTEQMKKVWKIGDFSKLFEKHQNTVDNWFKELEKRGVHYVNRSESGKEKLYDEEDYKIAAYINEKRELKWTIDAIIDSLPTVPDILLRGDSPKPQQTMGDLYERLRLMQSELESSIGRITREETQKHLSNQLKLLEEDKESQVKRRKEDILTHHKLRKKLRAEAEFEWAKMSLVSRLLKNKEEYIRKYEETYFEEKLNEEFNEHKKAESIN